MWVAGAEEGIYEWITKKIRGLRSLSPVLTNDAFHRKTDNGANNSFYTEKKEIPILTEMPTIAIYAQLVTYINPSWITWYDQLPCVSR